jgi:hypothetical protein
VTHGVFNTQEDFSDQHQGLERLLRRPGEGLAILNRTRNRPNATRT